MPTCSGSHLKLANLLRTLHRQPILADEVQTFKALITIHKVLQEGHPIAMREAQENRNWLESLTRGITGDGPRGTTHQETYVKLRKASLEGKTLREICEANYRLGYGPLLKEYVYFLSAKLAFHRQHPEFNGMSST